QVTADLSGLPGGSATTVLSGSSHKAITFPSAGTYKFTWSARALDLLGFPIDLKFNQLRTVGVAVNSSGTWSGQIVVAANPPPPGISIQLPGISVAPSVTGVGQLPTIGVPGLNVPTIPVNVPSIIPSLPGLPGGHTTPPAGGGSSSAGGGQPTATASSECVPCEVVPSPGSFPGFGAAGPDAGGLNQLGTGLPEASSGSGSQPGVTATAGAPTTTTKRIDLASNKAPAAQMPVLLAIIAIIALSLVTATYARLYLLRRNV
ncbi:MAG: hypothetical protein JWO57_4505, partial [Pseudonocardiales bacterium]|nr:hypothetical protein [Pseudonocardiales bacterium]